MCSYQAWLGASSQRLFSQIIRLPFGPFIGLAESSRRASEILSLHINVLCSFPTHRGANPDFSQDELLYQLETCKATFVVAHPDSLEVALRAAQLGGIPPERVIVFNAVSSGISPPGPVTVNDLVRDGLRMKATFVEPKISARTKLAFLSFSSGVCRI